MPDSNTPRRELYYLIGALFIAIVTLAFFTTDLYREQARVKDDLSALETELAGVDTGTAESEAEFRDRVESAINDIVAAREEQAAAGRAQPSAEPQPMEASAGDRGAIYGNPDAAVTLFVLSDFNCPYCAQFHPVVKDYVDSSGGEVNYVKLNYPIFGGASDQLAHAAECVQNEIGAEALFDYADAAYQTENWEAAMQSAGLDAARISACVSERRYQDRIDSNRREAQNFGVTGTPSTLIRNNQTREGTVVSGLVQAPRLDRVVQEVLSDGAD
jgi:protein-disulfide isomerase